MDMVCRSTQNNFLKKLHKDLRNDMGTTAYTHIIFSAYFRIYKPFLGIT